MTSLLGRVTPGRDEGGSRSRRFVPRLGQGLAPATRRLDPLQSRRLGPSGGRRGLWLGLGRGGGGGRDALGCPPRGASCRNAARRARWAGNDEAPPQGAALREESRRRPTLPPSFPGSTIGAGGLNFRVRYGTGCLPSAMATETLWSLRYTGNLQNYTASACNKKLVAKSSAY